MMPHRWYIGRTEPRAESQAAAEFGRDGVETFNPRVNLLSPRMGQNQTPLFPGYLFVRCDLETGEPPPFRTGHRLLGWISFGGEIPWLPDSVIDRLKEDSESINQEGGLRTRFRPGEQVRIITGSLQGLAEVIQDARSIEGRVKILLEFMGRQVSAQVPWEYLQPVQADPEGKHRIPRRTRGQGRWTREFRTSLVASA